MESINEVFIIELKHRIAVLSADFKIDEKTAKKGYRFKNLDFLSKAVAGYVYSANTPIEEPAEKERPLLPEASGLDFDLEAVQLGHYDPLIKKVLTLAVRMDYAFENRTDLH